jgi:glycerol-3-phosphate acyltransferase PlsX
MKIIVDAMGGDYAPQAPVEGALKAVKELGATVILVGRAEVILSCLEELGYQKLPTGLEIVHAEEVVEVEDNPATVVREKKDASMTVGLQMLKEGRGDAFVSAGSTGALLSAATLIIKRVRGIRRAALAPVIPTGTGNAVLIDCGATAECTPEYLLQYAFMGSYYAMRFLNRKNPKVGLLNIGAEPSKGTDLHRETFGLLKQADQEGRIHFIGNIEAKEAILGDADVIVTDGFSGNILLKTFEGTAMYISSLLKKAFTKKMSSKLGAILLLGEIAEMKKTLDPNEVGGTALLGISKPVLKAHGSSNAYAIQNAIGQALTLAHSSLIADITENIEYMRLPGTE